MGLGLGWCGCGKCGNDDRYVKNLDYYVYLVYECGKIVVLMGFIMRNVCELCGIVDVFD